MRFGYLVLGALASQVACGGSASGDGAADGGAGTGGSVASGGASGSSGGGATSGASGSGAGATGAGGSSGSAGSSAVGGNGAGGGAGKAGAGGTSVGGTGAGGGSAVGGAAGSIDSCDALMRDVERKLEAAKSCCPFCDSIQCTAVVEGTCCPSVVGYADSAETKEYLGALDRLFDHPSCAVACPEIPCAEPRLYNCVPGPTGEGRCE